MKRLLSFLSVVLVTVSIAAQTIDFTNIQITEENVHTKVVKKKYSFASLDYGFVRSRNVDMLSRAAEGFEEYRIPGDFSHAIGFTIGQVRQWGWYANIMFGTHMKIEKNTHIAKNQDAKPYNSCFSIVPGVMCRCGIPLYAFIGVGYGYQATNGLKRTSEYWDGRDHLGKWHWIVNYPWYYSENPRLSEDEYNEFAVQPKGIHSVAWQVGFMGIVKFITVKAVLNGIGPCIGAEFGVGYAFEHKN